MENDKNGLFGVFGSVTQPCKPEPPDPEFSRKAVLRLPFINFVDEVLRRYRYVPEGIEWRSPLFEFVRWMKARDELGSMDGFEAALQVEKALLELSTGEDDPWDYYFGPMGSDDPKAEFIATWTRVTSPANMDALQASHRAAQHLPLKPIKPYSPKYCVFLSIAGHLQRLRPGIAIALPVVRLGELIQCNRTSVGNYLKFAQTENLLRKTSEYVPHQLAAEFIFDVERFDWNTGKQIK